MFTKIEGDAAVVVQKGVYKQVDVFERNGYMWLGVSGGYVRIYSNGSTSKDGLRVDTLHHDDPLYQDQLQRLCVVQLPKSKPLEESAATKLLGIAAW